MCEFKVGVSKFIRNSEYAYQMVSKLANQLIS